MRIDCPVSHGNQMEHHAYNVKIQRWRDSGRKYLPCQYFYLTFFKIFKNILALSKFYNIAFQFQQIPMKYNG